MTAYEKINNYTYKFNEPFPTYILDTTDLELPPGSYTLVGDRLDSSHFIVHWAFKDGLTEPAIHDISKLQRQGLKLATYTPPNTIWLGGIYGNI